MKKNLLKALIISCALTALAAAAGSLQTASQWGHIDWEKRQVVATGIGAASPGMPLAAARPNAIRAAQITALRNALEIVKGIPLSSSTTVEKGMMTGDIVTTKIEGFLNGFEQQGRTKYMNDATVELTIEVPLDGQLAADLLPKEITDTPAVKKGLKETKKKPSFTGLIVDCTGLGLKPCMVPGILDDQSKELYGAATVSRAWAVKWGVAAYVHTMEDAKKLVDRIGREPLVAKAVSAVGEGAGDAMVNKKDGNAIKGNPANYQVLEECRVVFIVD
jgi:hypothetical protein